MLIFYHGHSEFLLKGANGYSVLFDPFQDYVGYPMKYCDVDCVCTSHLHQDHFDAKKAQNAYQVPLEAGTFTLTPDISITRFLTYHDDQKGALRGENYVSLLQIEGLKILHMGDFYAFQSADQIAQMQDIDLLLLPVGETYTLEAKQAVMLIEQLRPKTVIPMHYKTKYNASWDIQTEGKFLSLLQAQAQQKGLFFQNTDPFPLLRVTKEDISCLPPFLIMEIMP